MEQSSPRLLDYPFSHSFIQQMSTLYFLYGRSSAEGQAMEITKRAKCYLPRVCPTKGNRNYYLLHIVKN